MFLVHFRGPAGPPGPSRDFFLKGFVFELDLQGPAGIFILIFSFSPNIACNMGSWRRSNKISMKVGWWVCRSPLPVFYHTFCTLGAFRLRETSYRELKPCKLQWFLHLRVGPPAKTIGNRSENFPKTKQNKMRPLARLLSYPSHA